MKKTINMLLIELKTEEERKTELFELVPEILKGNKVYYKKNLYIYLKDNNLYSGEDNYKSESLVKGAFPYIFFLEGIYEKQKCEEYI